MYQRGVGSKAQVSVFVIVGLVLLILAGLSFVMISQKQQRQLEEQADVILEEIQTETLNNYLRGCLKNALEEGIQSMGRYGGKVMPPRTDFQVAPDYFIQYGINEYTGSLSPPSFTESSNDWRYPKDPTESTGSYFIFTNVFPYGKKTLPVLCQKDGPNDVSLSTYAKPCPPGRYSLNSMQKELSLYTARRIEACVKEENVEKVTGFTVELGRPKVTVVYGEEDVTAEAQYPVEVQVNKNQVTKFLDYKVTVNARLKKMYGLMEYLLYKDSTFLDNKLMQDGSAGSINQQLVESSKYFDANMEVSIPITKNQGDVIRIVDKASKVQGSKGVFQSARKNRKPVLDYIHGTYSERNTAPFNKFDFDILVKKLDAVTITGTCKDPDEDECTIRFEGWKTTQVQEYNDALRECPGRGAVTLDNQKFATQEDLMKCMQYHDGAAQSTIVQDNMLSFTTGPSDFGLFTIKVIAEDPEGLQDWQDVKILVYAETATHLGTPGDGCVTDEDCGTGMQCNVGVGQCYALTQLPEVTEEQVRYMNYFSVFNILHQYDTLGDDVTLTWDGRTAPSPDVKVKNDVFKVTLTPEGNRKHTLKVETAHACPDRERYILGQTESCTGAKMVSSSVDYNCQAITGTSFEKNINDYYGEERLTNSLGASPTGSCISAPTKIGAYSCKGTCVAGSCVTETNCVCDVEVTGQGSPECYGIFQSQLEDGIQPVGEGFCFADCSYSTQITAKAGFTEQQLCESWNPNKFINGMCCESESEEVKTYRGINYCCAADSCIHPKSDGAAECVAPGSVSMDGNLYCASGGVQQNVNCQPSQLCKRKGIAERDPVTNQPLYYYCKWVNGKYAWKLTSPRSVEHSQCGECGSCFSVGNDHFECRKTTSSDSMCGVRNPHTQCGSNFSCV
jgi:hypothetical protein